MKKQLRKDFLKIRNSIPEEKRKKDSSQIAEILFNMEKYRDAKTIFIYVDYNNEAETGDIIKCALNMDKIVSVPYCDTTRKEMYPIVIDKFSDLKKGSYGILEPEFNEGRIMAKESIDLCIVPALAFDKKRYRLGYGGGYYDKFLNGFKGLSIGLAFSECITDTLPVDKFDKCVDMIITPREMI